MLLGTSGGSALRTLKYKLNKTDSRHFGATLLSKPSMIHLSRDAAPKLICHILFPAAHSSPATRRGTSTNQTGHRHSFMAGCVPGACAFPLLSWAARGPVGDDKRHNRIPSDAALRCRADILSLLADTCPRSHPLPGGLLGRILSPMMTQARAFLNIRSPKPYSVRRPMRWGAGLSAAAGNSFLDV